MTAEELRTRVMAQRQQAGLVLTITDTDGHTSTLYPKDHATLEAWTNAALAKGYIVRGGHTS